MLRSISSEPSRTVDAAVFPVLRVVGARRRFAGRVALDGVDLVVAPGEIVALLGPNGAGKTTLVRAISGRLRLDSGEIAIGGRDPCADPAARRGVGLVPQEIALYSELTARQNLEFFGRLMGLGRDETRKASIELLERVALADRADDPVSSLSGGMKRRLNIAAGIIHHPKALLLDEPTVGVDPAARERIHDLVRELRSDGLAVLLTTHDLDQATELADRVGVLIDGRIRAAGTVADLVRELFGESRELLVSLRENPTESGRGQLEAIGLEPSDDRRVWTGALAGGLSSLPPIEAELERAGLVLDEIRLREPGLRSVFFRLAGREIDR